MNTTSGKILQTVAIVLTDEACFIPPKTIKLNVQMRTEPPIIDHKLFPPVNTPGKK